MCARVNACVFRYGIGDEKVEILPLFLKRIQKTIDLARTSKDLELLQNGLNRMPIQVCLACLCSATSHVWWWFVRVTT
jgi:hypothetical protein